MSSFPGSPRVQKGAIIGLDPYNPLASVIIFQYNPEKLTRSLTAQSANTGSDRNEVLRLKGPPSETISLNVDIDATDQLERADRRATALGIYPALSSLEMLLYPKTARMIANDVLLRLGVIEVIPPEAPLTLFVWGAKRVLPVQLTSFSITETDFDTALNPIRANVELSLQVLSYTDLGMTSRGGAMFLAHQVVKEAMATINGVGSISSLGTLGGGTGSGG